MVPPERLKTKTHTRERIILSDCLYIVHTSGWHLVSPMDMACCGKGYPADHLINNRKLYHLKGTSFII